MNKTRIAWAIRILVFVLFVVSAVAKMFPIWAFEKQLVDLNVASWCSAPYFSRLLIGVELALRPLGNVPYFSLYLWAAQPSL